MGEIYGPIGDMHGRDRWSNRREAWERCVVESPTKGTFAKKYTFYIELVFGCNVPMTQYTFSYGAQDLWYICTAGHTQL